MKRFRILFRRVTIFEEFVFASSEASAEELAWEQLETRDDPEPYETDTRVTSVEEDEV